MSYRRVPVQAAVWALRVIVLFDVLLKQRAQVLFAEDDDMIKELAPQGADDSLNVWILPRAAIGDLDFFDAAALHEIRNAFAVDPIVVPVEVLRLQTKGCGLPELLDSPFHRGTVRDRPVNKLSR